LARTIINYSKREEKEEREEKRRECATFRVMGEEKKEN